MSPTASRVPDTIAENGSTTWLSVLRQPRCWALALCALLTTAFFLDAPSWNQNSRIALTHAMADRGALDIDDWHPITGDKSWREGHFYSDKAPGVSAMGVVPWAVYVRGRRLVGLSAPSIGSRPLDPLAPEPELDAMQAGDSFVYSPAFLAALWLTRVIVVGGLSMVAFLATWLLAAWAIDGAPTVSRTEGRARDSLAAGVASIALLATPALPYATAFYGHQACAALLIIAAATVWVPWRNDVRGREPSTAIAGLVAGLLGGLAVATEYTAALPTVALALLSFASRGARFGSAMIAAGAACAALLAAYHTAAFGAPWKTGYDFVYLPEFREGMAVRYGLGPPDPRVLTEILFGRYRGLLVASPVLILAAWGHLRAMSGRWGDRGRRLAIGSTLLSAYYLLLNAGYYMWDGGAAFGPRHCVPMLPWWGLGALWALRELPRATVSLAALSVGICVAACFVGPEMPRHGDPIWEFAVPSLWQASFSAPDSIAHVRGTLASRMGLSGAWGLLPLGALWLLAATIGRDAAAIQATDKSAWLGRVLGVAGLSRGGLAYARDESSTRGEPR